jgi:hypothetical protein
VWRTASATHATHSNACEAPQALSRPEKSRPE